MAAHRIAWILSHGPIPDGMYICHHCDTKACVRPSHLFVGTAADNTHDAMEKGLFRIGGDWRRWKQEGEP
jgi:hypothetical protein